MAATEKPQRLLPAWLTVGLPAPRFSRMLDGHRTYDEYQRNYRQTQSNRDVAPYQLHLLRPLAKDGWELSASLFNVFDRKCADPAAFDPAVPARDRLEQDGRPVRVKAVCHS